MIAIVFLACAAVMAPAGQPGATTQPALAGGTLMAEPEAVGRLVGAMAAAMRLPVTVKIRSGAEAGRINAVEISRVCEGAGAAGRAIRPPGRRRAIPRRSRGIP
jgi:tRNA-dihydrouridine synthase B